MTDSERAQLLKKLLARVRANADARPPPGTSEAAAEQVVLLERPEVLERAEELKAWPTAGDRTSFPEAHEVTEDESAELAMRIDGVVPPKKSTRPPRGSEPLAIAERGVRSLLRADRWSELVDEGPMSTFASDLPLPPPPLTPSVEDKSARREVEGALERAVQHAARERAAERGAIWLDLVAELRERRGPQSRPSVDELPQAKIEIPPDLPPMADPSSELTAALAAMPPIPESEPPPPPEEAPSELPLSTRVTAPPVARSVSPEESGPERLDTLRPEWTPPPGVPSDLRRTLPSSLLPPSRRARRRSQRWAAAKQKAAARGERQGSSRALAFVAALAVVFVVIVVAWMKSPPRAVSAPAPAPTTTPTGGVAPNVTSPVKTTAVVATTARESAAPSPSDATTVASAAPSASTPTMSSVGITPEEGAPKDTPELPESLGYLFVSSKQKLPVYLNGLIAGDTQSWMKVACGWRYLRLARHGSPPAGSSFPVWATDGHSVLVPCRGATRVDLEPGP